MKIDFHIHTIPTKKDEADERKCKSAAFFVECLQKAEVTLSAITNHNYFSLSHYNEYSLLANKAGICVLPGIELDVVLKSGNIGHSIVIVNPNEVEDFHRICKDEGLTDIKNANNYTIDISKLVELFKNVDSIFITHYGNKSKSFNEEDVNFLRTNLSDKIILIEPSNLISAFIYLSHDKNSLVGSDCRDWKNYPGKELPELKVPISDYNKLKLLFKKDESIINNELKNKNRNQTISFTDSTYSDLSLSLPIYNDVNIIFGGKSTGKSIILKDIKEEFNKRGLANSISSYIASEKDDNYKETIMFSPTEEELAKFGGSEVDSAISRLKNLVMPEVKSIIPEMFSYLKHKKGELEKKIGFVECIQKFPFDETQFNKTIQTLIGKYKEFANIDWKNYESYLSNEEKEIYDSLNTKIKNCLFNEIKEFFVLEYSNWMANKAIDGFKEAFKNNKGTPTKPNDCGLLSLFNKIKSIDDDTKCLNQFFNAGIKENKRLICHLDKKGTIYREELISTNPKTLNKDYNFKNKNTLIKNLKDFQKKVNEIENNANNYPLFKKAVSELSTFLNDKSNSHLEKTLNMIGYTSHLVKADGSRFDPSSGERSIVLLGMALADEKDIYIFDEPELSVGHDYINRVIIPRLKQLSKMNKIIIICTHDANIAVRTLPYMCIYREENFDGTYSTFIGNPFSGVLKEVGGSRTLDWKSQTIEVLEGGPDAFGEREVAYGKQ